MKPEAKATPRQCAIHPCKKICPDDHSSCPDPSTCTEKHVTCDRHRERESSLLSNYYQFRDRENERIEREIAERIAVEEENAERRRRLAPRVEQILEERRKAREAKLAEKERLRKQGEESSG